MPNTGKPSQDCHLCRSRRVKCDLARPACQRCIKYGAECPGYRDPQELVFRNANPANVKKRRPRDKQTPASGTPKPSGQAEPAPLAKRSDGGDHSSSSSDASSPGQCVTVPFALTRPLNEHWTNQSVPILLSVWSTLDFVRNVYHSNVEDGPLMWAAHLFSRTYVTNIRYPTSSSDRSREETTHELGAYLGKTLSTVYAELKKPDGPQRNDVLATVWILANYELLVGSLNRELVHSPFYIHAQGLYSILKARGTGPLATASGRMAFWPPYNMVQVSALICGTPCPPESEEWLAIIERNLFPHVGLGLAISQFIVKVARTQSRAISIINDCDPETASREYESMIEELQAAVAKVDSYVSFNAALIQNLEQYMLDLRHATVVKAYHVMHLLANLLTHYTGCEIPLWKIKSYQNLCIQKVRGAAQAILCTLPAAMKSIATDRMKSPATLFDALKLVWPLVAICAMSTTLPEQKAKAKMALTFLGEKVGVRQGLNTFPGDRPTPDMAQRPKHLCWSPQDD